MPTVFDAVLDDVSVTTVGYAAGSTSIALSPAGAGARFGSAFPLIFSTYLADGETAKGVYRATGRTGDTLTGITLIAGTDADLPSGSIVEMLWTAEHVTRIYGAINAAEAALAGLGTAAAHAASDFDASGAAAAVLPAQSGHATQYLTTDGTAASWAAVPASGADALGTYLVQTATHAPANAQVLGALATGLLKVTTTTGVLSTAAAGTDYLAPTGNGSGLVGINGAQIAGNIAGSAGGLTAAIAQSQVTGLGAALAAAEQAANKGVANGYAGLDSGGKVPTSQIPSAIVNGLEFSGTWNAATNSPTLASGVGAKGTLYKVSVSGATTLDGVSAWNAGDFAVFDGATWDKIDGLATEVLTVAGRTGAVVLAESDVTNLVGDLAAKALPLVPTAVKTGNYAASAQDFVPVDTTSGTVIITLPTAPADKSMVAVKHVIQGGTNTVTINTGGSDVLNKTGGVTTMSLTLLAQGVILQYKATGAIWYVLADDLALAQLDLRYDAIGAATTAQTNSLQKTSNLSDLNSATTARTNLGLGTAAVTNTGTGSGNVPVLDGNGLISPLVGPQLPGLPPIKDANLKAAFEGGNLHSLGDGAAVATWSDVSGNGNDLTQATSNFQPTFLASAGPEGVPAVRCNGTYVANTTFVFPRNAMSLYMVISTEKQASVGDWAVGLGTDAIGIGTGYLVFWNGAGATSSSAAGNNLKGAGVQVISYRSDGTNVYLGANGYELTIAQSTQTVLTGTTHTSTTVDGIASTAGIAAGWFVTGSGIPANTTISSVTNGTTIVLSQAATASATVSLTFSAPMTGFALGGFTNGSFKGPMTVHAAYFIQSATSATTAQQYTRYLQAAYRSPAHADPNTPAYIFAGNSLTRGVNTSATGREWPEQFMDLIGRGGNSHRDISITGAQNAAVSATATNAALWFSGSQAKKLACVWEGTNDLTLTAINSMYRNWTGVSGSVWSGQTTADVFAFTTISHGPTSWTWSTAVTNNTSLRSDATNNYKALGCKALVDLNMCWQFGQQTSYTNTTWYESGGNPVHLTDLGYSLVAWTTYQHWLVYVYPRGGGPDPQFPGLTTDATATTIKNWFPGADGTYLMRLTAEGTRIDSGTEDVTVRDRYYRFRISGGAVGSLAQVGSVTPDYTTMTTADIALISSTSGPLGATNGAGGVDVQVTGEAGKTIAWKVTCKMVATT